MRREKTRTREIAHLDLLADEFDMAIALDLASNFISDTKAVVPAIEVALELQDAESIRHGAHIIKGCARVVKSFKLSNCADLLEVAAGNGDWQSIEESVSSLKTLYRQTTEYIEDYTRTHS